MCAADHVSDLVLIVQPKDPAEVRGEYLRFLDEAKARGWMELKVRFGFAWGSVASRREATEEILTPDALAERVMRAEANGEGSIGSDDLHVTPLALGVRVTFCHESDIHLEGPVDSAFLAAEAGRYAALGWKVHRCGAKVKGVKVRRSEPTPK